MRILGIETSCDETSAAVVKDGREILSNVVLSQEKLHQPFCGIVPEIASRAHLENINRVIEKALKDAFCWMLDSGKKKTSTHPVSSIQKIDAIAVTIGPGLVGSLLVGKMTAEALGWIWNLPVVGVNHLEAHLFANMLDEPKLLPPFLGLIVSGGHTDLVLVRKFGNYRVLGRTRDDAAGECFDKAAKILGLSYPGGPEIERLAKKGNPNAVRFARPYLKESWDFSFSGLKTAVLYCWQKMMRDARYSQPHSFDSVQARAKNLKNEMFSQNQVRGQHDFPIHYPASRLQCVEDLCASFQRAVVDVLVTKTLRAAKKFKMKRIVVGGGVAANSELRERFVLEARKEGLQLFLPSKKNCTDNAAMVASAGYYKLKDAGCFLPDAGKKKTTLHYPVESILKVDPSLPIANW